ncbi:hypothetical protein OGAPHI_001447 [Ogataea philodendri]|uniref:Uncharacterized protein n=1 Tax=Ogataea philodendri TaxID=1378263 RepID=A0A9P8PCL2_9ASCO|nr:uncharacterized protein OGAPHI_001447 [Ogataea philodendri]KAH3669326.1 hypothetical protein OGAPHI_001447 [Ogataea philodendri]
MMFGFSSIASSTNLGNRGRIWPTDLFLKSDLPNKLFAMAWLNEIICNVLDETTNAPEMLSLRLAQREVQAMSILFRLMAMISPAKTSSLPLHSLSRTRSRARGAMRSRRLSEDKEAFEIPNTRHAKSLAFLRFHGGSSSHVKYAFGEADFPPVVRWN